jgi:methylenetetrahydrofolate reductase (NADPH)
MTYSLEVYPEPTQEGRDRLMRTLEGYAKALPIQWASVTCSNQRLGLEPALSLARDIQRIFGWKTAPHVVGRGQGWQDTATLVESLRRYRLTSVVALRGDGPRLSEETFPTGADLIAALHELNPQLEISAACYPERHPESLDDTADLAAIQAKVNAGASQLITQFTLEPGRLTAFLTGLRGAGISTPVLAGIIHPGDPARANRLAQRFGINPNQGYNEKTWEKQCGEALQAGYAGIHLFTLNQPLNPMKGALHASL